MTLEISCRAAMTTRPCTDKVHCLRVTIISDITQIRRIILARWNIKDRITRQFTDYYHPGVLYYLRTQNVISYCHIAEWIIENQCKKITGFSRNIQNNGLAYSALALALAQVTQLWNLSRQPYRRATGRA